MKFAEQEVAEQEVIALLPAGGQATRLAPLPLSKELYPIGFFPNPQDGEPRPKVVCHYLLEKMQQAGISKAFIILRPGKWDIPAYLGDGTVLKMNLAYLTVHVPYGVPYTLDQAYPFVRHARIALGFPDILFEPEDAFTQVLSHQSRTGADVVLGLFPTQQFQKAGMVDFDDRHRVLQIIEKPKETSLRYMWAIAVWTPAFTEFMHDYLQSIPVPPSKEVPIGDVIQAAIEQGLRVEAIPFSTGTYLDVGTPQDLIDAIRKAIPQL